MAPKSKPTTCGHPDRKHLAHGMCSACYSRWKRETESEKYKGYAKRYREKHREQRRTSSREYARKNKERMYENSKLWRANNPELARKQSREWHKNNLGAARDKQRRWRSKNKEKLTEYEKSQYAKRKEARDALVRLVIEHYGAVCVCCGESNRKFLTIDHVNNDGAQHKRSIGRSIYRWLKNNGFPREGFQIMCFNCNCGRARNGGVCPHRE